MWRTWRIAMSKPQPNCGCNGSCGQGARRNEHGHHFDCAMNWDSERTSPGYDVCELCVSVERQAVWNRVDYDLKIGSAMDAAEDAASRACEQPVDFVGARPTIAEHFYFTLKQVLVFKHQETSAATMPNGSGFPFFLTIDICYICIVI